MPNFKLNVLAYVKGIAFALVFSLVSILLFAFLMQIFSMPITIIKPINYAIKVLGILIACLFAVKEKGILNGMLVGVLVTFFAHLLFGSMASNVNFDISFLWELLLGLAVGAVGGIISVTLKK